MDISMYRTYRACSVWWSYFGMPCFWWHKRRSAGRSAGNFTLLTALMVANSACASSISSSSSGDANLIQIYNNAKLNWSKFIRRSKIEPMPNWTVPNLYQMFVHCYLGYCNHSKNRWDGSLRTLILFFFCVPTPQYHAAKIQLKKKYALKIEVTEDRKRLCRIFVSASIAAKWESTEQGLIIWLNLCQVIWLL